MNTADNQNTQNNITGAQVETRGFKMHPNLLMDVIRKQAGTVEKAVLEAVMNSVDAGSTRCEVQIQPYSVSVVDDGKGFRDRQEIELFFETFGQPHQEGDAKYGRFRMGRGQLFAFGVNEWRTGEFRMLVDVKNKGLDYELETGLTPAKGCAVDIRLYAPLGAREIDSMLKEIAKMIKYVEIPVSVNGAVRNTPPDPKKFLQSTDDAYIRITDGSSLAVYNQGVFVREYGSHEFGCAGVVSSKVALDVNFARNDVIKSDPVWQRIRRVIDTTSVGRVKKKLKLNDAERENIIQRIVSGEMKPDEAYRMTLFKDVSGKLWSPMTIAKSAFPSFTTSFDGDMVGDRLITSGQCLVLEAGALALFDVNPDELFGKFDFFRYKGRAPQHVPYGSARKELNSDCIALPPHLWTPKERMWLAVADRIVRQLVSQSQWREVRIGMSNVAESWTDGKTYICLSRDYLLRLRLTKFDMPFHRDIFALGLKLVEMLAFDSDSREGRLGGSPEHYESFHDRALHLPHAVNQGCEYLTPANYQKLAKRVQDDVRAAKKRAGDTSPVEEVERDADIADDSGEFDASIEIGLMEEAGNDEVGRVAPSHSDDGDDWPDVVGEQDM